MATTPIGWWQRLSKVFSRQRVLLWTAFSTCFFVFLTNLVLTMLAFTRLRTSSPDNYVRDVYSGSCDVAERASIGAHALVNILSTMMLWASNLAMQLVAAPTREAVDMAHERGQWLDIGILSLRNMLATPKPDIAVWMLLATSSLPVHFLYNSVIFNTLHANAWRYYSVREDFFTPPHANCSESPVPSREFFEPRDWDVASDLLQDYHDRRDVYKNVSILDCLKRFDNPFDYRPNVFLVHASPPVGNGCPKYKSIPQPAWSVITTWVRRLNEGERFDPATLCYHSSSSGGFNRTTDCGLLASNELSLEAAQNFIPGEETHLKTDYCIYDDSITPANQVQRKCYLQCSPHILAAVTAFNWIKCLCILWVIRRCERRKLLNTLGDTIASFLERPDPWTKDFGVASKASIMNSRKFPTARRGVPIIWERSAVRWWHAVGTAPWAISICFMLLVGAAASVNIGQEVITQKSYRRDASLPGLWKLGFGEAKSEAMISWHQQEKGLRGLLENLLVANIWQFLLSVLYISFNVILTTQLVAREWAGYAATIDPKTKKAKTLRVSKPKGSQRATYYLSMPYRYGLPVNIIFTAAHWLLSQSTFTIRLLFFDWDGTPLPGRTLAGFSIIPSFFAIVLTSSMFTAYILNAIFRWYPADPRMPLVGTNSLAISANCHPPKNDKAANLKAVTWGVVESESQNTEERRCTFTSLPAEPPGNEIPVLGLDENPPEGKKGRSLDCESWWYARLGIFAGP
ncbi:hypothetical protein B0T25DRAFT_633098 [Lasiosphaeria hispida]|uniref:DUF6536 domain-containing protein n=1 Tax=Lasiosphaeria hispida TaxID=260671 RepID=A0AAJ0HF98_9PEZI|nr:hypothetical protein B0T25DRAFT_633098 [Lasiosphaeria hispida]